MLRMSEVPTTETWILIDWALSRVAEPRRCKFHSYFGHSYIIKWIPLFATSPRTSCVVFVKSAVNRPKIIPTKSPPKLTVKKATKASPYSEPGTSDITVNVFVVVYKTTVTASAKNKRGTHGAFKGPGCPSGYDAGLTNDSRHHWIILNFMWF